MICIKPGATKALTLRCNSQGKFWQVQRRVYTGEELLDNFLPIPSLPSGALTEQRRGQRRMPVVPVSELVGHSEGQGQPCVLVDVAAPVGLAHPCHVGQTQCLAGPVHCRANVLPGAGERTDAQTQSRERL